MKIRRKKKLKNLLLSKKKLRFGDKAKICFACGASILNNMENWCPQCKTYNKMKKKKDG